MSSYNYEKFVNAPKLADEIFAGMGIVMKAALDNDTVEGWICSCCERCCISFYDENEAPNENHKTTLQQKILNGAEETQLDAIVAAHDPNGMT